MLVRDIMSKDVLALGPKDTVSKFIGLMEKHHIHEVPIVDGKKFLGVVHYKTIAAKGFTDPSKERLETVMTKLPALKEDNTLDEAADAIFRIGYRAFPVISGDVLSGIISVFDLLNVFSKNADFKNAAAEEVMSPSEVISIGDDIGKARMLMRERNISRQPVVDENGKLRGIVTVFDLLKAVKPKERINWYSMAAEKETIMGVQISAVMNSEPLTAEKQASLGEISGMMSKHKNSGVVIVGDNAPIGIVTTRDLLEFYLSKKEGKGVYVQITGLGKEDPFVSATADRMVRDSMQKIASFLPIQYLFMHTKQHDIEGARKKYSVRCRLMTGRGMLISKAVGWDLRDAVGQALDELERIAIRGKEKARDKVWRKARAAKGREE